MGEEAKGTITIQVFDNKPYEVTFTGVITGVEIDLAWKMMMRSYRLWKHTLIKKETVVSGGV